MEHMTRIGIVLPYFGKLPNYFPLFLTSCRHNPTIDWLVYTDSDQEMDWPENVKVTKTTFDAFRARLQQNFDFPICLDNPYKLCDFKPTYGDTLAEDLTQYNFWGHCDCDLVFGDLRHFLTEEIFRDHLRILCCGHLSLYKNVPEVNRYYRTQPYIDYQNVLQSPGAFSFDEWPGLSECWLRDGMPYYGKLIYDDLTVGVEDFRPINITPGGFIGPYHNEPDESRRFRKMKNILYRWNLGKLERCWVEMGQLRREETAYVHMQKRKMSYDPDVISGRSFLIVPGAFLPDRELSAAVLQEFAPVSCSMATRIRLLKDGIKVVLAEVKNIGRKGYCSRSAIVNHIKTYWSNTYK